MTEIGSPWFDNTAAGESVTFPHGVTIDENGFIYIGEKNDSGDIRRFSCDGTIHPTAANGGFSIAGGGQTNITSYNNTLYSNHWNGAGSHHGISAYDLCDGSFLSEAQFCGINSNINRDWGLFVDKSTGTFYSTSSFLPNGHQFNQFGNVFG